MTKFDLISHRRRANVNHLSHRGKKSQANKVRLNIRVANSDSHLFKLEKYLNLHYQAINFRCCSSVWLSYLIQLMDKQGENFLRQGHSLLISVNVYQIIKYWLQKPHNLFHISYSTSNGWVPSPGAWCSYPTAARRTSDCGSCPNQLRARSGKDRLPAL